MQIKNETHIATEELIRTATKFGLKLVKEIAKKAMAQKPDLTVLQLIQLLDTYAANYKAIK